MKQYVMSDYLERKISGYKRKAERFFLCALASLAAGVIGYWVTQIAIIFAIAASLALAAVASNARTRCKIAEFGAAGEAALAEHLRSHLGGIAKTDEFVAFHNIPLRYGDLDCLLLTPAGAFAIEVKSHKGLIVHDNGKWRQEKVGAGGTVYAGGLKAPSQQLMSAIHELKVYLGTQGVKKLWLHGVILFTGEAEVVLKGQIKHHLRVATLGGLDEIMLGAGSMLEKETRDKIQKAVLHLSPARMIVQEPMPQGAQAKA